MASVLSDLEKSVESNSAPDEAVIASSIDFASSVEVTEVTLISFEVTLGLGL